ncbi:MAG: ribonuclease P protein subunit [Thermoplasmata archaeon]|nr:ribonuclease P protein subunit [Thermoplasmata archaeon]
MRKKDLLQLYGGEVIGLKITIEGSTDPSLVGRGGWIIDETQKTLRLREGEVEISVPKKGLRFRIVGWKDGHPSKDSLQRLGDLVMEGDLLIYRHYERLKKVDRYLSKRMKKEV